MSESSQSLSELERELKELIVDSLCLEEVNPSEIDSDEPLFGDEGLALDSIDGLEIGVEVQKRYGVKIDPDDEHLPEYFTSVRTLARFVARMRQV